MPARLLIHGGVVENGPLKKFNSWISIGPPAGSWMLPPPSRAAGRSRLWGARARRWRSLRARSAPICANRGVDARPQEHEPGAGAGRASVGTSHNAPSGHCTQGGRRPIEHVRFLKFMSVCAYMSNSTTHTCMQSFSPPCTRAGTHLYLHAHVHVRTRTRTLIRKHRPMRL